MIQGYEQADLVQPSGRNNRGYLLYDTTAIERIRLIRKFQRMGFSRKEIYVVIDQSPDIQKNLLEKQLVVLKCKEKDIRELITEMEQWIASIHLEKEV